MERDQKINNCLTTDMYPGVFCDGTRRNAVPEVLSQKDANPNGVPEPSFPGIGITNTPSLRPNFVSLCVPKPTFF
jgi:hypothetical protein